VNGMDDGQSCTPEVRSMKGQRSSAAGTGNTGG